MALLRTFGISLGLALLVLAPARAQVAASEYEVKAAFLYNFTKFVEWPESAFRDEIDPFWICVVGDDPFGKSLRAVVEGQEVEGRQIKLRPMNDLQDPTGCHLLFLGRTERQRTADVLAAAREGNVLTVGEAEGFLEQGGVIQFTLDNGKVRFDINPGAAERVGLKISSKLLRLATLRGGR